VKLVSQWVVKVDPIWGTKGWSVSSCRSASGNGLGSSTRNCTLGLAVSGSGAGVGSGQRRAW
jgi:hypothetical protein